MRIAKKIFRFPVTIFLIIYILIDFFPTLRRRIRMYRTVMVTSDEIEYEYGHIINSKLIYVCAAIFWTWLIVMFQLA